VPDVIGIRVKCPECGATTRALADVVTCEYCGTESRVQRRTQVLQRPIPLPLPTASQPRRVAVQMQGTKTLALVIGGIAALVALGGVVVAVGAAAKTRAVTQHAREPAKPPPPPPVYREWNTDRPLVTNVDGDGTEDVVGIVRYLSNRDEMHLAAQSGRDGHVLWETPSLGTYDETYRAKQAIVEGVVLWGDTSRQRLEAYDLKTGKQLWHAAPAEALEQFCRAKDQLVIELKDQTQFALELATGALTKLAKPTKCTSLDTARMEHSPSDLWNTHLEGMSVDEGFATPTGWILATSKSPGTSVPMLAVLDKKKKELWRATLPAKDPMTAKRAPFHRLGFDDAIIADAVLYAGDTPFLEVFDRATGERKLDVPIVVPAETHRMIGSIGITVAKSTIFVYIESDLQAYDRTTGQRRWHVRTE